MIIDLLPCQADEDARRVLERWLSATFDSLDGPALDAAARALGEVASSYGARRLTTLIDKASPQHQAAARSALAAIEARIESREGGVSLADDEGGALGLTEGAAGQLSPSDPRFM